MLKMTKIQLEKISDSDKHIFIEDGMRGSICFAAKKHSKANDSTETKYHDMNNLYGKAIMSYLPYGAFKWIKVTDKNINTALNKKDNSLHGYILEVDMNYHDELHDYQNCFPMATEKLEVTKEMLSSEQIDDLKNSTLKLALLKN